MPKDFQHSNKSFTVPPGNRDFVIVILIRIVFKSPASLFLVILEIEVLSAIMGDVLLSNKECGPSIWIEKLNPVVSFGDGSVRLENYC
jgi:hypothetical protein